MSILRNIYKSRYFWFILLATVFGITRLTNLTILPIFTDEAIYIRWSQIGNQDAAWRFISMVDGKQPLFTWILMVLLEFISDPLWAGRFVSVLAGACSLVGIYLVAVELFKNKTTGLWAGFLYILSPFSLMYDRLAMYDSLVATFSIWNLYLGILLVRRLRLDIALILGICLGAGMLNKTSGFLSLYFMPATLFLFKWNSPFKATRLLRWIILFLVAIIISQLMYNILRLSPLFHMIKQKDAVFVYPLGEWLKHPFEFWYGNIKGLIDWLINYLTWPIFIISTLSLFVFWKKPWEKILLLIWTCAPIVGLAFFGKVLYPRFILFTTLPVLILGATTLTWFTNYNSKKIFFVTALILIFLQSFFIDYFIVFNPRYALIPWSDKGQLIDDWPAGWGVKEVNSFLKEKASKEKIIVYTEGTFGLLPYSLEIYLINDPNIKIQGIWPLPNEPPLEILENASKTSSFLILNQSQEPPAWPLEFIAGYQKGNRANRMLRLYKIVPSSIVKL